MTSVDVVLSGNVPLDAILYGSVWQLGSAKDLTYSFAMSVTRSSAQGTGFASTSSAVSVSPTAQVAMNAALTQWAGVANLNFVEVDETLGDTGTLRISTASIGIGSNQLAYAFAPANTKSGGDIRLSTQLQDSLYDVSATGQLPGFVLLHELGHALGLKHPHSASPSNSQTLARGEDSIFNSAMSYFAWPGIALTKNNIDRFPTTPMALDIETMQFLYGANTTNRGDDDIYQYDSAEKYLETIYDTGGIDTIQITGGKASTINLQSDAWSKIGAPVKIQGGVVKSADTVRIYKTSVIENAVGGSGSDRLIGNEVDNRLQGSEGNDTIHGNNGNDTIEGGAGRDQLKGGEGADRFVFSYMGKNDADLIHDFTKEDMLALDTTVFSSLLAAHEGNFVQGKAHELDDYLIYKPLSGCLYYDPDGVGKAFQAIKIVTVRGLDATSLSFEDLIFA